MKKRVFISILLMTLLLCILTIAFFASGTQNIERFIIIMDDVDIYVNFSDLIADIECHIDQIRVLVPFISERNRRYGFDADYFTDITGIRLPKDFSYEYDSTDLRLNRLHKLQFILIEAKSIVDNTRDYSHESPYIIVGFRKTGIWNNTYSVTLLGEEYLALTDLIIEFTGIPKNRLEVIAVDEFPRYGW